MGVLILSAAVVLACQPVEIVSGDTLRCEGRTVQLADINAEPGSEAAAALVRLTGKLPTVCRAEPGSGRPELLGRCWAGGRDLGCAMVEAGWATAAPRRPLMCR